MTKRGYVLLGSILMLASCGGAPAEGTGATTPTSGEPPPQSEDRTKGPVPSPPQPWDQMSMQQRREWMVSKVTPRMAELFEEYDAERFADFGCDTCHGEDMSERQFEMPNPSILPLHPTGSPEQEQMVRDHPEMVRFMFSRVVPTMQTLLGAPDYDEATGEGFSCYYCHTRGGAEATQSDGDETDAGDAG